ncbi:MAG TPA: hypothetical protein VN201_06090, partial [Roseateles sp.]|nr:hypothetical protein [Roseateles sp.]
IGDRYEALGQSDARVMVAIGNAVEAPPPLPVDAAAPEEAGSTSPWHYATRDQIAEHAPAKKAAAKKAAAKKPAAKGTYKRRDQVAEGE